MVNMTLAVPEELKKQMDKFPEINWSEVARKAIQEKAWKLVLFESLVAKSKLTEKDALEIGCKVSKALHERYKKP